MIDFARAIQISNVVVCILSVAMFTLGAISNNTIP